MESESSIHQTDTEMFKSAINEWIGLHDSISETQKIIKEKRQRQKKLSEFIIAFMEKENKEFIVVGGVDTVALKKSTRKQTLKREDIHSVLQELFNDEDTVQKSVDKIFDTRIEVETASLKLTR